jgi:hypothetical protein
MLERRPTRQSSVNSPHGIDDDLCLHQRITATKHVPQIGFLQITQAATEAAALPSWSGHRVRVGELWRQITDAKDADPTTVLVCASASAVVSLHPRGGTEDAGLGFLTGLGSLHWG